MPDVTLAPISTDDPQTHEETHVHAVYEQIASHFSSTRYKPWPIIAAFMSSIPTGWVGLDSGCGNGKYLPLPLDRKPGSVWTMGLDRSRNLLEIARGAGGSSGKEREVVRDDVLGFCWRPGIFDFAISIATIHHLATPDRRKGAVQRLITSVSPSYGRILIYVWAIEQDSLSKRAIPVSEDGGNTQGRDVFVPWKTSEAVYDRYYHMFAKGELASLVLSAAQELGLSTDDTGTAGIRIVQDGWERSNYYVEIRRWTKNPLKDEC